MPWKWWLARLAGMALIVLGAALFARSDEPSGSVAAPPTIPPPAPRSFRFGPPPPADVRPIRQPPAAPEDVQLVADSAVPAPVVTPTTPPSSTAPAAANASPAITVTIPHDDHMHFTHVRHWHFPSRPARAAKPAPAPAPPRAAEMAPPALPSPQAPSKLFGHLLGR